MRLRFDDVTAHRQRLDDAGYTVLRSFVEPSDAERLKEDTMTVVDATRPPFAQLQQSSQYLKGSMLDAYINSDALLAAAEALHGDRCWRFLPFTAVKAPGGGEFDFHQDDMFRHFDKLGMNFWLALDDVDEDNGCLSVVPGSHKLGRLDWVPTGHENKSRKISWIPDDAVPVPLRQGDCLVFDRLTIHGSGPNRTDGPRVAYSVTFHLHDASFYEDGQWWPLLTHSRWRTMPVDELVSFAESAPGPNR